MNPAVARALWKLAVDYQQQAATLANGKVPDIREPPRSIHEWA